MPRNKLSDANFEIMRVIWAAGESTAHDIHRTVNSLKKRKIKRETVQVQLRRLEKYGWLRRRKEGKTYYYSALLDKEEALRDIISDVKERIFEGSQLSLIKCLFDHTDISREELDRIKDLLDQYGKT
jgi:predicted transcriptional regulator